MFSVVLKAVKNVFSSSGYESDQPHNLPREALAEEINTSERRLGKQIMVQTRRRSQAATEAKVKSTRENVATRKRPRVLTHVEIVIPNKRQRMLNLNEYVDIEVDKEDVESEGKTTGHEGTMGHDELAMQVGEEQKDAAVGDDDVHDKEMEDLEDAESTKPLPIAKSSSRKKRGRKGHENVEPVVVDDGSKDTGRPDEQKETTQDSPAVGNKVSSEKILSKSKHIKFGDDEPSGPSLIEATSEPHTLPGEEEQTEDEDEAPEAESLSTALIKAKARTRGAARAIERQEAEARDKRRIRDKRLKEQASLQKAKKQKKAAANSLKSNDNEEDSDTQINSVSGNKQLSILKASELPDVLPDEILAAKPYVRSIQPDKKQTSKKHILFQSEEKPPKDIQRGGVRVRVLETNNPKLPPKSSKNGKALKESWLAGRSGKGGVIERRKMRSSFLRQ